MADKRKRERKKRKALKRLEREALRFKFSQEYWLGLSQNERQNIRRSIRIAKMARIDERLDLIHLKSIKPFV